MLKTGCGLNPGPAVTKIDGGQVQALVFESRHNAGNFGTKPAGKIAVSVNSDADLTLLHDGMNLDGPEGVGANPDMHLEITAGGWRQARI